MDLCLRCLVYLCLISLISGIVPGSSCPRETLPCDDGTCIDRSKWCNKVGECPDQSDEKYCREKGWFDSDPNYCEETHFLCDDGRCVPLVAKCDGIRDCKDSSDEKKCESESSTPQSHDLRTSFKPQPTSEDTLTPATLRANPAIRRTTGKPSHRKQDPDFGSQSNTESSRQIPRPSLKPRVSQDIARKEKDSRILNVLHRRPDPQQTLEVTQTPEAQHRQLQKEVTPCPTLYPRPTRCPQEEVTPCPTFCCMPRKCPEERTCCPTPCPRRTKCPDERTLCPTHCARPTNCPEERTLCPTPCPRPTMCPEEEEVTPCPIACPRPTKCPEEATCCPTHCPRPPKCPEEEVIPCPTPCPKPTRCPEEGEVTPCPRPTRCPEEEEEATPYPTPCPIPTRWPEEEEDEEEEVTPCPTPCPRPTRWPEEEEDEEDEEEEVTPCPTPCPRPTRCPEEGEVTPCPRPTRCPEEEEVTPCPTSYPVPTRCPEEDDVTPCPMPFPRPTRCPEEKEEVTPRPTPCPRPTKCPEEDDVTPCPMPCPRPTKCPEEEEEEVTQPCPTSMPRPKKCPEEEEEKESTPSTTRCPKSPRCPEEEKQRKSPSTPCPRRTKCLKGGVRTPSPPPPERVPSSTPCPKTSRCPEERNPSTTPCPKRKQCPEGRETSNPTPPLHATPFGPTKCPVTKTDGTQIGCPTGGNPHKQPTDCKTTPTPKILMPPPPLIRRLMVPTRVVSTANSLRLAREWLLHKWTDSQYGWSKDTPRALVALSLSENRFFYDNREGSSRMKKQLQVFLAVDVLRNNTEVISLSRLSLYINAMLASCLNPRDFHGIDLVDVLRKRTDSAHALRRDCPHAKSVTVNPLTYLTLCLANDTSEEDVSNVEGFLEPKTNEQKWLDMQAFSIMAYSCMLKSPYLSSPRKTLLDASVNTLVNRMENDGSFGSIYSTALAVQALTAAHPVRNWNPGKSVGFLKYHQHPDGSFGDLLATYYIMPVLAGKSLVDLQNVMCPETDDELTLESLRNSRLPMHYIRYSLYFGKPIQSTNSKMLRVPVGSNFFQIMKLAAEMDLKFRFEHEKEGDDITVYAISNIPNDAELGMQWKLYLNPNSQVAYEDGCPVKKLRDYDKGVQFLIPEAGDHVVFWYQPYLKCV